MRFTRGPEPLRILGGHNVLRRDFTHPHLWYGVFGRQQRAQQRRTGDRVDVLTRGHAGRHVSAASLASARFLALPSASKRPSALPSASSGPLRSDRVTDCDRVVCACFAFGILCIANALL